MTLGTVDFTTLQIRCRCAPIGKKFPDALYVHYSALEHLDPDLQAYERAARQVIADLDFPITLIKFNTAEPKVSYLYYPDFDQNPHPALNRSIQVEVNSKTYQTRHYGENPPILHRKETFVAADYPLYSIFTAFTQAEEKLGLLANSRYIGHLSQWEEKLRQHGVRIVGHRLITENINTGFNISIERHKAAIVRRQLSRPVRVALEAELFTSETTFFDYGCGHGEDLQFIAEKGFIAQGWDPPSSSIGTIVYAKLSSFLDR